MRKLLVPSLVTVLAFVAMQVTITQLNARQKMPSSTLMKNLSVETGESAIQQKPLLEKKVAKRKKPVSVRKNKPVFNSVVKSKTADNFSNDLPEARSKDELISNSLEVAELTGRYKVPFSSFRKNVSQKMVIDYKRTGTQLTIPANAFVDEAGKDVEGVVEIRYKEFVKPSEIFMSGIPMHLQGDNYLESAGMFQIEAWQNGKKLQLKDGVAIEVNMLTTFTDDNYNLYAFNDNSGEWDYENNNFTTTQVEDDPMNQWREFPDSLLPKTISVLEETVIPAKDIVGFTPDYEDNLNKKENTVYRQCMVKLQYKAELFPDLEFLNAGYLEFIVYTKKYTELADMANKMMDKETGLSMGYKDLLIQYPGRDGMVDLNFINLIDTFRLGAEPVFKNNGERKRFINDYYKYRSLYDKVKPNREVEVLKKIVNRPLDMEKDTLWIKDYKRRMMNQKVERSFLVGRLMTWNCDRPFPLRPYEAISVYFKTERNVNIQSVYAAVPGKNSVFQATDFKFFNLVGKGNMYIWTLLDQNTVAYTTPDKLKEIKWDKKGVNEIELDIISLETFLPFLDREILSNTESLEEFPI